MTSPEPHESWTHGSSAERTSSLAGAPTPASHSTNDDTRSGYVAANSADMAAPSEIPTNAACSISSASMTVREVVHTLLSVAGSDAIREPDASLLDLYDT